MCVLDSLFICSIIVIVRWRKVKRLVSPGEWTWSFSLRLQNWSDERKLIIMRAELKEYQAVEAAAMNFVKSVAEGNSTYAKKLFIDEAVLFGYLDGELQKK